jgi:subtilisin family serine protease
MPIYRGIHWSENALAIDVAVKNKAAILTNSWGGNGGDSSDIRSAVDDALAAGKVVLFSAGNGPNRSPYNYNVHFPATLTETTDVICVGGSSPTDEHKSAASSDGEFWWGSSYVGPGPDVTAPAPWSYTTDIQGIAGYNNGSEIDPSDPTSADYTATFNGTSSATPKVAGVVALMLSANPHLTPKEVKQILRETADDIGGPGDDDLTGAGRVNALRAVRRAMKPK